MSLFKINPSPARHASGAPRALLTAALVAASVLWSVAVAGTSPARAQTPPPADKTLPIERQSPTNPYPAGLGDFQNRARGASDVYWGVTDDNTPWNIAALSRVQNGGYLPLNAPQRLVELDGWTYPRASSQDGIFITGEKFTYAVAAGAPTTAAPAPVGQVTWTPTQSGDAAANNNSTNVYSPNAITTPKVYYRSIAYPRPAVPALTYNRLDKFAWALDDPAANLIPGAAGQATRYRIFIHIPDAADSSANENRIDDARYTVYYYIPDSTDPTGRTLLPKQQTFLIPQMGGGDQSLKNPDGTEAFFPLYSAATFGAGSPYTINAQPSAGVGLPQYAYAGGAADIRQGVALDNTTEDQGSNLFVIADALELEPSFDRADATPTITPAHGGRKTAEERAFENGGPTPPQPGVRPTQPRPFLPNATDPVTGLPDPTYNALTNAPAYQSTAAAPAGTGGAFNSLDFINNPYDPIYNPADPNYVAINSKRISLETWNPSTIFQGPESFIDPRLHLAPGDPLLTGPLPQTVNLATEPAAGWQVGPTSPNRPILNLPRLDATGQPVLDPLTNAALTFTRPARAYDATNQWAYGKTGDYTTKTSTGTPVPFFSQIQILIAKTQYAQDPENGVPDSEKTGTKTIQLGSVYSVDWLTGATIWRFPDRTYLPANTVYTNGVAVAGAGLRNANIGVDPTTNLPVSQVPGIVAVDRNGNGIIEDDEVFIGAQGQNTISGVFASVTLAPRVMVQGRVSIPVHDQTVNPLIVNNRTDITGVIDAPDGRYFTANGTFTNGKAIPQWQPVPVGVAYIAAANGVIYAVDAYGNNDTRYIEFADGNNNPDVTKFGTFSAGTTNVLWTFSATNRPRVRAETLENYNRRLQQEIPATGSFGASAPTLAYQYDESEFAPEGAVPTGTQKDRTTAELRLFVGNQNGVLYALDARGIAGLQSVPNPPGPPIVTGPNRLPFRKGVQLDATTLGTDPYGTDFYANGSQDYRKDLKWWFRTQGAINTSPAISVMRQDQSITELQDVGLKTKGVYVTTQEGRVYAFDWDGPVERTIPHTTFVNFDGTAPTAQQLNDDFYFHNTQPATSFARPDTTYGNIRPRWTFPQLYIDIGESGTPLRSNQPPDKGIGQTNANAEINGITLAQPDALGAFQTAPMLMDFYFHDSADPNPSAVQLRSYVVVVANDPTTDGTPATESRVYLLDQNGDRANFMNNPRRQLITAQRAQVVSQPRDRYSPKKLLGDPSDLTIPTGLTWTYRYQYDTYNNGSTVAAPQTINDVQQRNSPNTTPANLIGNLTPGALVGQPGRRMTPTVFVGGGGEIYALDLDPETGLFLRWRGDINETRKFAVLPPNMTQNSATVPYPGIDGESTDDQLIPADHEFDNHPGLFDRRILARRVGMVQDQGAGQVTSLSVSGGPLQNRSNLVPEAAGATPVAPTVPNLPTNDVPNLRPFVLDPAGNPSGFDPAGLFNQYTFGGHLTNFVNQEINDPMTVTRGAVVSALPPNGLLPPPNPAGTTPNNAFQYPMLFATTADGHLHMLSSNIEGEDVVNATPTVPDNPPGSDPMAWAFAAPGDTHRYNIDGHVHHDVIAGPGGPGGVAILTNAYFHGLDPRADTYSVYDPATGRFTANDINTAAPAAPGQDPNDNPTDPRPGFTPRPISAGEVANPALTPVAQPLINPDYHTGKSGFPLDLNGLSFDKHFAGGGNASPGGVVPQSDVFPPNPPNGIYQPAPLALGPNAAGQDPNGDYHVWLRMPGYSDIGTLLTAPFLRGVVPPTAAGLNNQLAEGVRGNPPTGNLYSDDINPAAQNITWIYSGSDAGGALYAYTPAVAGQGTGGAGGVEIFVPGPDTNSRNAGLRPQVDIYPVDRYYQYYNNLAPTAGADPKQSIAALGGKNFFEWGETVYIVVSDILIENGSYINPSSEIEITITSADTNQKILQRAVPLRRAPGGRRVTYTIPPNPPATVGATLGMAFLAFKLDNPSQDKPLTPGDRLDIQVTMPNVIPLTGNGAVARVGGFEQGAGGDLSEQRRNNPAAHFAIGNPLAVQGFLTDTSGGSGQATPVSISDPSAPNGIGNGIGPFASQSGGLTQTAGVKTHYIPGQRAMPITDDPNVNNQEYAQALTNGNTIQRRDLTIYSDPATRTPNGNYGNVIRQNGGGDEPRFYMPVATSPGYVNHGTAGTTAVSDTEHLFRLLNRSLLGRLPLVRVLPDDQSGDLLYRAWPGLMMNANADIPGLPSNNNTPTDQNNPRLNPSGMDYRGTINRLPWETEPAEARPWATRALVNNSLDYPDIPARKGGALRVLTANGDLSVNASPLDANVGQYTPAGAPGPQPDVNSSVLNIGQQTPPINATIDRRYRTSVSVTIPQYQPANVTAAHDLTSTYIRANQQDDPRPAGSGGLAVNGPPAPLQLPRRADNRLLRPYSNNGVLQTGSQSLSPFGYTSHVIAFIDYDRTGRLNPPNAQQRVTGPNPNRTATTGTNFGGKAYREFEVWTGVPVDQSLKIVESVVDVSGQFGLGHGFGMQNGLLGYGGTGAYQPGFIPPPLFDPNVLGASTYSPFYKQFTVQNTGNTNLWNLRASQRIEFPNGNSTAGSGFPFQYLQMRAEGVDPRFGILAAGADPKLPNNLMPQVATSLDPQFDAIWDQYIKTGPISGPYTAQTIPGSTGTSPYEQYYQQFGGLHTAHKPRVGATSPAVLSIPDLPTAQFIRPVYRLDNQGNPLPGPVLDVQPSPVQPAPVVGVAVPIGTPVGTFTTALANSPFTIFEDHDTSAPYNPTPTLKSANPGFNNLPGSVNPAGPLYGGQNDFHPGNPLVAGSGGQAAIGIGPRAIRSFGNGSQGVGIWRPRRFNAQAGKYEYQPNTYPFLTLQAKVTESALTGQAPDRALPTNTLSSSIITGVLPGIDPFPMLTPDTSTVAGQTIYRASASLTPASWRDSNGNLHVYFARNVVAAPGQPYNLFHSTLAWDKTLGTWVATRNGAPQTAAAPGTQDYGLNRNTTGTWFATDPTAITGGPGTSDTSPFVLQHYAGDRQTVDTATLFWLNTTPTAGGAPLNQVMWADVTNGGSVSNVNTWFQNADPGVLRYAPRVVYDAGQGRDYLFFYGGAAGRWSIYYSVRRANNGTPVGNAPNEAVRGREVQLPLPAAIVSASDPAPVVRQRTYVVNPATGTASQQTVVDVYYSGILSSTQTPDLYMTRYSIAGNSLTPIVLPRINGERLKTSGASPLWQGRHISWYRVLGGNAASLARLPVIYVTYTGQLAPTVITTANRWQFDAASGLLYQTFNTGANANQTTFVYVDASSGTVRFRGPLTPRVNEPVIADYEPQTYRITTDGLANSGPFTTMDNQILPATLSNVYVNPPTKTVIRRQNDMVSGRNWLFWHKGAAAGQVATLYYAARRVGIDLKDPALGSNGLLANESILLTDPQRDNLGNPIGNQTPVVASVTVGFGIGAVAFDVDYINGRIYVEPQYEGLPVTVAYQKFNVVTKATAGAQATATLAYLDELAPSTTGVSGVKVPMAKQTVNESQAYALLDVFNPFPSISRPVTAGGSSQDPYPGLNQYNPSDPTLPPGRVWLFWASPRGRQGLLTTPDPYPSGYDLMYETLAPNFEGTSYQP